MAKFVSTVKKHKQYFSQRGGKRNYQETPSIFSTPKSNGMLKLNIWAGFWIKD
jgi:hypothetical protein